MNEPPDPGGGNDFNPQCIPQPSNFITIDFDESSIETDHSITNAKKPLKRRLHKICKQCNKKVRKNAGNQKAGCNCSDSDETNNKNENNKDVPISVPQLQLRPDKTATKNPIGRNIYNENDVSPYLVHIQKITKGDNDGVILHPITFGDFLMKNKIYNIINGSLKKIGRNRISVAFNNFKDANSFLNNSLLLENNYHAFIPSFNVIRIGIVRGVPIEWSPEEIIKNISTPIGCGKVVKVRRLNYKTVVEGTPVWKPTQSVVIYFDGRVLPKRIFICYNSLPVELYIFPTIQCYKCCRYGHTKLQCRSKPRCLKCGQEHTSESCNAIEDNYFCCLCSGNHMANSKACPEFNRQKSIKLHMAEKCVSYAEANKEIPTSHKSYSEVSKVVNISQNPNKSYKKTFISRPRDPIKPNIGYDKIAHKNIIKEFSFNEFEKNLTPIDNTNSKNDFTNISDVLSLLQSCLQNNKSLPSIVAPLIQCIVNIIQNGQFSDNNSVER